MGMNQEGDGLIPLNKEMTELLEELKNRPDEEDLYNKLCVANRVGTPLVKFFVGEILILKGHEWEVTGIGDTRLELRPLRRL